MCVKNFQGKTLLFTMGLSAFPDLTDSSTTVLCVL